MPVKIKQGLILRPKVGLTDLSIAKRILRVPNANRFICAEAEIIKRINLAKKEKSYRQVLRFEDQLLTSLLKRKAKIAQVKACLEQMITDAQKGKDPAAAKLATERYEDIEFILQRFGYPKN